MLMGACGSSKISEAPPEAKGSRGEISGGPKRKRAPSGESAAPEARKIGQESIYKQA